METIYLVRYFLCLQTLILQYLSSSLRFWSWFWQTLREITRTPLLHREDRDDVVQLHLERKINQWDAISQCTTIDSTQTRQTGPLNNRIYASLALCIWCRLTKLACISPVQPFGPADDVIETKQTCFFNIPSTQLRLITLEY